MATPTTTPPMPDMPRIQAYRQPAETVMAALNTNAVRGLTTSEAQTRLARYGKNVLPAAPPTPAWRRFLAQFQNPLTALLLIATIISSLAWVIEDEGGLPYEALAILTIVILKLINQQTYSLAQVVDILLLAVSLAVAAVPEGLTAITTIVLSLGMARMLLWQVIQHPTCEKVAPEPS